MIEIGKAGIGTIKFFDKTTKSGVIVLQGRPASQEKIAQDVYFEIDENQAKDLKLRVGQLVQFVLDDKGFGAEAKEITVLNSNA